MTDFIIYETSLSLPSCGWLSVVAIVSLGAQAVSGIWWIDSVGSLAIVWLLVKEGREAWRGEWPLLCLAFWGGAT